MNRLLEMEVYAYIVWLNYSLTITGDGFAASWLLKHLAY